MWNHLAIVGLAASAALASAEGLITLDKLDQPAPVVAAAPMLDRAPASDAAVAMEPDGHYWAEADVDGKRVRFLVDTGATAVALTLNDARRLGLDLDHLDFSQVVRTAWLKSRWSRSRPRRRASFRVRATAVAPVSTRKRTRLPFTSASAQ